MIFLRHLFRAISPCLVVNRNQGKRERERESGGGADKTKAANLDASNDLVRGYGAEQFEPEHSLL